MCGIVGLIGAAGETHAALAALRHRGPDARGQWHSADGRAALGHARLAILDLDARANQPLTCPRTGNVLIFNGEIYNYRDLRAELVKAGWVFRTTSDAEVLLAAYGEWGEGCLPRLNGMFAFAVYEEVAGRLFLARDRIGKKPLYYAWRDGVLGFASELKGLLALWPELPRELDPAALAAYLDLGYIPGELCIYRAVRKLPPAHCALLADGRLAVQRYWQLPPPDAGFRDDAAALDQLDALLDDAVRLRLQSDVPVGVFLSGGLDSSLVAAYVARHQPGTVACTASFPDPRFDETPHAARVAQWLGLPHRILPVGEADGAALAALGRQFDEPFADSSLLPTYLISRAIRREVTVALSGDGGDELFAGYAGYAAALSPPLQALPGRGRQLLGSLHRCLPTGVPGKNFLRRLPLDGLEQYLMRTRCQEELPPWPLSPALLALVAAPGEGDRCRRELLAEIRRQWGTLDLLQQLTRLDALCYLPDDVLVKVDRASMLTSLEVRSPLLDYRLIEFAFRLPDQLRFRGGRGKYLLRRLGERYLPPDFAYARKQGFSIPESAWFRAGWRDLPAQAARQSALVDPAGLALLQQAHDRSGRLGVPLFRLLMLLQFEACYGPFA